MSETSSGRRVRTRDYVRCYALLAALALLGYLLLDLGLRAVRALGRLLGPEGQFGGFRGLVSVGYVVVALLAFVAILGAEGYLRRGLEARGTGDELLRRFIRLALPMLAAVALCGVIIQVVPLFLAGG